MWQRYPLCVSAFISFWWILALLLLAYAISVIPHAGLFGTDDLARLFVYTLIAVIPLLFLEYDLAALVRPVPERLTVTPDEANRYLRGGLWLSFVSLLGFGVVVHVIVTGKLPSVGASWLSSYFILVPIFGIAWFARTVVWYFDALVRVSDRTVPVVVVQGSPPTAPLPP